MSKKQFNNKKSNNNSKDTKSVKSFRESKFNAGDQLHVNDPVWYKQSASMAESAAKLSYSYPLGYDVKLAQGFNLEIPTLMVLNTMPTFGVSTDAKSPMNMAAQLLYSYVRHANSGSRNYESADLLTYVLAMDSAYMMYAFFLRTYGMLNYYTAYNRIFPKSIIENLGFDYDDLAANMADFNFLLNQFATRLNSFCVPKDMYIYDRHAVLFSNVFKDSELEKSQIYAFRPDGYYTWIGTRPGGSGLLWNNLPWTTTLKLSNIKTIMDDILNNLYTNEDIGLMSGDILKSFGESGIRQLSHVDPLYSVKPIYTEDILSQIHNATIVNVADDARDVNQNDNLLYATFGVDGIDEVADTVRSCGNTLLDAGMIDPSVDYNLESTRLVTTVVAGDEYAYAVDACGSEIITGIIIYDYNDSITGVVQSNLLEGSIPNNNYYVIPAITNFDWAPLMYIYEQQDRYPVRVFGDIFNYTVVNNQVLNKIHETCLMSLLNVYGLYAKYNK